MMAFLRLIRPINLVIIALTMVGVIYFLSIFLAPLPLTVNQVDVFVLILSTVMIAAAGNIINDYFDVKADRINKPEKLIITKHLKRRWAIVWHWSLNAIAFGLGVYLSAKYDTLIFAFIHLISINLLWFYSMVLKRKVLIGNLIVAFLTSLIPVLALIFVMYSLNQEAEISGSFEKFRLLDADFALIHLLALFAFIQNLAREIVKDMQDIEGDKLIYVKSLPMVFGVKKTSYIVVLLLFILPAGLIAALQIPQFHLHLFIDHPVFFAAGVFNIASILLLFIGSKNYSLINALIKIAMLLGVLSLYLMILL
jgi:4-hydroxybenzoate polyprenyltransferase